MAQKLVSDWLKVATSGKTVDGREITETEISQMASHYDAEEYTSNIWYEHIRYFGNLGQVIEAKAEKDKKDRLCLFVKLSPSAELIELNNQGQKIFTSVEIHPNFCDTGEAYLVGLAVTDQPASVGTSQLNFSRCAQEDGNYFSDLEEVGTLVFKNKESLFSNVVSKFKNHSPKEQENDNMSAELLEKIANTLTEQSKQLEKFNTRLDAIKPKDTDTRDDKNTDDDKDSGDDKNFSTNKDAPSKSEFDALKESFNTVSQNLEALTKKFNTALTDESDSTNFDEAGGGSEEEFV